MALYVSVESDKALGPVKNSIRLDLLDNITVINTRLRIGINSIISNLQQLGKSSEIVTDYMFDF